MKQQIRLIISLHIIFFCSTVLAQDYHIVRAKLRNTKDSSTIAYAHVGMPRLGLGVITNQEGEFEINLPKEYTDTIEISHLSYDVVKLSISEFVQSDSVIYMSESSNILNDVFVYPKDSIRFWLEAAITNIKANGPQERNLSIGFYREVQYEKSTKKYTRLVEGAIEMQDKKYNKSLNNLRIRPIAVRKSDNNVEYTLYNKALKLMFGESNPLQYCVTHNPIRSFLKENKKSKDLLNVILNDTTCEFSVIKKNADYIVLSFDCPDSFIGRDKGEIVLKTKDMGIVKCLYGIHFKNKSITYRIEVHQRKIKGVYMPILIQMQNVADLRKVNEEADAGISISTLVFTEHYTNKRDFDRVKRRQMMKKDLDLYNQDFEYNPVFWKNYNVLLKEPLAPEVVRDLEKERELEKQFSNNSKKTKR